MASLSCSSTMEPTPVSTRMFLPSTWSSRQFKPNVMRFFQSVVTVFAQVTLGTCPNTDPPSSFITPSLRILIDVDLITLSNTSKNL